MDSGSVGNGVYVVVPFRATMTLGCFLELRVMAILSYQQQGQETTREEHPASTSCKTFRRDNISPKKTNAININTPER